MPQLQFRQVDPIHLPTRAAWKQALFSRATGQLKNVGFLAFMMWMSGSQIHLFSIMMVVSGIYQPITAIVKSGDSMPHSTALPCLRTCAALQVSEHTMVQLGLCWLEVHLPKLTTIHSASPVVRQCTRVVAQAIAEQLCTLTGMSAAGCANTMWTCTCFSYSAARRLILRVPYSS